MKITPNATVGSTAESTGTQDSRGARAVERRYKIDDPSAIVHLSSQATRFVEGTSATNGRVDFRNVEPREMRRVAKEM